MRELIKVCLPRAAALAAVHSLANWHELGHFISFIQKLDGPRPVSGGRSEVYVKARLNTGRWISCFCLVIPRASPPPAEYPIEQVLVSFDEPCGKLGHLHFLCELSGNGIIFPHSWVERPEL